MLQVNPILSVDSYKLAHAFAYPNNVTGMFSYIEARTNGQHIMIPFGLQMWLKKFMTIQITLEHINEAEAFALAHGEPFKRSSWERVVTKYNGYLPLTIRAVPEGTPVRSGNALITILCEDEELFWLCSYIETALLRAVWYPTTIASLDYESKRDITRFYEISGSDLSMIPFALHDFGARGVAASEQAEIGGAAHLVNFMGSDTIEGVRAANYYYKHPMAGFSVPATEHSVECSFGKSPEQELQYLRHVLRRLGKPGGIVSIVLDGYDVYRATEQICNMKEEIIASGCKVVLRPDSGDMLEVVPRMLRMLANTFGTTKNSKGYLKLNNVAVLQGDGIDRMSLKTLLGNVVAMNFSADNVVLGSGGGLLQKVNRDTFKFAMKAAAIRVRHPAKQENGLVTGSTEEWIGIAKDPITDPGKKSKEGLLTLARSKMTNQLSTVNTVNLNSEFEDVMVTVYKNGTLLNETTLDEIRARCVL